MNKREDVNKTLVLDFALKIVDLYRVNKVTEDSFSLRTDDCIQRDLTLNPNEPFELNDIRGFVAIRSWGSFSLLLNGTTNVDCTGIFISSSSYSKIVITSQEKLRISIVYS